MAKLYFTYATMNSGKSTQLLQTEFNYRERNMRCLLLTAAVDTRYGSARITSRLGISAEARTFEPGCDLMERFLRDAKKEGVACVLCDEAQFLTRAQVEQLAEAVDQLNLPVMCYGLRTDFQGNLFEGAAALMALADTITELKTICRCGRKATQVLRTDSSGKALLSGAQVQIGGNESYISLCRKHWSEARAAALLQGEAAVE